MISLLPQLLSIEVVELVYTMVYIGLIGCVVYDLVWGSNRD